MNAARRLLYATATVTAAVLLMAGCAANTPQAVTPILSAPAARQLEERTLELPQDRTSAIAIAVYCMTGGMSAAAVDTLAGMGYVDLVELRGGMAAWEADGRPLIAPTASQGSAELGQES